MIEIKLTQGKVAMIDDEDFDLISQYKWFARKSKNLFYAAAYSGHWRTRKLIHMHRLIIGDTYLIVDHKDRNGLNNTRSNLRVCSQSQNCANRTSRGGSRFLGVSRFQQKGKVKWRAFICSNKKNNYLGLFDNEEQAAIAYNKAAKELHGDFANLNIIQQPL